MKIKIDGDWYDEFNSVSVTQTLNAVATVFSFTARYDRENPVHKKIMRPFQFLDCDFYNDAGVKFVTGQIVSHDFLSNSDPNLVQISGYSNGGVLEDCSIPLESYPLESIGRSLKDITERLISYFNLKLTIDSDVRPDCNLIYSKSCGEPTGTVKDYLAQLATQRNVVLGHDRHGRISYYRPNVNAKSRVFYDGTNSLEMSLSCNGQGMHSKISALRQPSKKNSGNISLSDSINNPFVKRYRPSVQTLTSGEDGETSKGVKNLLAEELKSIKINFSFDKWQPLLVGDIVEVLNPEIFINKKSRFMVESTTINEDEDGRTMTMSVVLPESFTGDIPINVFNF